MGGILQSLETLREDHELAIWGVDLLGRLWGDVLPVPAGGSQTTALVDFLGRRMRLDSTEAALGQRLLDATGSPRGSDPWCGFHEALASHRGPTVPGQGPGTHEAKGHLANLRAFIAQALAAILRVESGERERKVAGGASASDVLDPATPDALAARTVDQASRGFLAELEARHSTSEVLGEVRRRTT